MTPRHALRALGAIVDRELRRFVRQHGRLASALVRPLLWLAVFAAGFRNVFGVSIVEPYDTYVTYDVYLLPGLLGMVMLFNGMQSSLSMVHDREAGVMRLMLTAPLPRPWLLFSRLAATVVLSLLQALAFVAVAAAIGTDVPRHGPHLPGVLAAMTGAALMLGSLGLLLTVAIRQLENFAGTMNFVIFPLYFLSTALYPMWKLQEAGTPWLVLAAQLNPFTHAVEWMRFAMAGKPAGWLPVIVLGVAVACFAAACVAYDPQRGIAGRARRGAA